MRLVMAGAEKLRETVANAFYEKFGLALLEGYGCTEMAPVVCANASTSKRARTRRRATSPER